MNRSTYGGIGSSMAADLVQVRRYGNNAGGRTESSCNGKDKW